VLLDAVVQLAGQAISLLDHRQGAHLIGEARVALPQLVQVLLVFFQMLGQEVELTGQAGPRHRASGLRCAARDCRASKRG